MKNNKVILLDEAVADLEVGRNFYDAKEEGIGAVSICRLL